MVRDDGFGNRLRKLVEKRSTERSAQVAAAAGAAAAAAQRYAEAASRAQQEHARQLRVLGTSAAASRLSEFSQVVLPNLGRAHRGLAGQYALLRCDDTLPYWYQDSNDSFEYPAPVERRSHAVNGFYLCRKDGTSQSREQGSKQLYQRYGGVFAGFVKGRYGVGWAEWAPGATELEFSSWLLSNDGTSHPDGKWMDRQWDTPEAVFSQQVRQFTEQELTWLAARLLSDKVPPGIRP